jgi:hypothetical protein
MKLLDQPKHDDKIWFCPLCGYGPWKEPYHDAETLRQSYDVCDCCGCEYGYDDEIAYFEEWVAAGMKWFDPKHKPENWKFEDQLKLVIRPWPPKEHSHGEPPASADAR